MSDPAELADILDLLMTNEQVMADLYEAYEKYLPAMDAFWKQLVIEERAHADVISALRQHLHAGRLTLRANAFDKNLIRETIVDCLAMKGAANESSCHPVRALENALSLERAMIEREFFNIFTTDNEEMLQEFAALKSHTSQHIGRIAIRLLKEQAHIPH